MNNFVLAIPSTPVPGSSVISKCTFEQNLCGYTNDKSGDIFDWKRQKGRTSSSNTGPPSDHTLGTPAGWISH